MASPDPEQGDEFAIIAQWFAPLARQDGARGLLDDVAVLDWSGPVVLTSDTIVEGVHFLPDDPIDRIARKALRVNLSDVAAKGATPIGYLLNLAWPRARPASQIEHFAAGLAADQDAFNVTLLGGDTTSTPGPLTISITMLGRPHLANPPSRAGARSGDRLWVSGVIGDGWLGLKARLGALDGVSEPHLTSLTDHYQLPSPRLDQAEAVARLATASMDVSDGLIADCAKLAAASGVACEIAAHDVPLSAAGRAWAGADFQRLERLLTGGDDYQILIAARPDADLALSAAGWTAIGDFWEGRGMAYRLPDGRRCSVTAKAGYAHRLGNG
jgi:thiamine-monophosphate kinase